MDLYSKNQTIHDCLEKSPKSWTHRYNKSEFWKNHIMDSKQANKVIEMIKILARLPYEFSISPSEFNIDTHNWYFKTFQIIIHYPNFTIRNKNGSTHRIKDLYVRFLVELKPSGKISLCKLWGIRGTMTPMEISFGYMHSHLHPPSYGTDQIVSWQWFCLGQAQVELARIEFNSEFSLDTFELLLYSIESYIKWESLDGGPYRKIGEIDYRQKDASNFWHNPQLVESIFKEHILDKNQIEVFKDSIRLVDDLPVMVTDESLHTSLVPILPEFTLVTRDSDGYDKYGVKETPEQIALNIKIKMEQNNKPLFYFRGEPVYFKLGEWSVEEDSKKKPNQYVSRKFIETLKKVVDDKLNKNYSIAEIISNI